MSNCAKMEALIIKIFLHDIAPDLNITLYKFYKIPPGEKLFRNYSPKGVPFFGPPIIDINISVN